MTSAEKIAANRANARKSTGPRTSRGKARSRANAFRHGFASAGRSDPHVAKKIALICSLLLEPDADIVERQLAETIAECEVLLARIRLARISAIETMRTTGVIHRIPKYLLDERVDKVRNALNDLASGTCRPRRLRFLTKDMRLRISEVHPDYVARLLSLTGRPVEGYQGGEKAPRSDIESVLLAFPHLVALDRYEKRALSRRRRAIEELAAIAACKPLHQVAEALGGGLSKEGNDEVGS